MYNYEIMPKLRHLTLTGYENGEYIFVGKNPEWDEAETEEYKLLHNQCLNCSGDGLIETYDDGDNCEWEVSGQKECLGCNGSGEFYKEQLTN